MGLSFARLLNLECEPARPAVTFYLSNSRVLPPRRMTRHSVGYDLFSPEDAVIEPGEKIILNLKFSMKLPYGTYGRIAPKSSLANFYCIDVLGGVIDPDYSGEVHVLLFNHSDTKLVVTCGDPVAQLICERAEMEARVFVGSRGEKLQEQDPVETVRCGGLGSTAWAALNQK